MTLGAKKDQTGERGGGRGGEGVGNGQFLMTPLWTAPKQHKAACACRCSLAVIAQKSNLNFNAKRRNKFRNKCHREYLYTNLNPLNISLFYEIAIIRRREIQFVQYIVMKLILLKKRDYPGLREGRR